MHVNDMIMMQRGASTDRVQHTAVDEAYHPVVSHGLFPMALIVYEQGRDAWKAVVRAIAEDLDICEDVVRKIVELEVGNASK